MGFVSILEHSCLIMLCLLILAMGKPVDKDETDYSKDLAAAEEFLRDFDARATQIVRTSTEANWAYATDLTPENMKKSVEASMEESEFFLQESEVASKLRILDLPTGIQRQKSLIGKSAHPTSRAMRIEIKELQSNATSLFGKAKVCLKRGKNNKCLKRLSLEPELTDIMKKSRDPKKLLFAWLGWRNAVGPPMKYTYEKMIDLLNIGAREHGWIDYGDFLRSDYEMGDDFEISLKRVWETIEPLYKELHAYVRYRLRRLYRSVNISESGTIPAHLLGDMWAQDWENIFDLVKPFRNTPVLDVTDSLRKQDTSVVSIFKLAENFFLSLGLYKMPHSFWERSVFEKPKDKDIVCHASAWDFSENSDVRIKMCTEINQKSFITVHHEMGHLEYFLAYKNQPFTFRSGANPGFHEAIGDTVALSVETPSYLSQIGLLENYKDDEENNISFLLRQALRRIAPIPYNYLVDKWRWRVFEGNITSNRYNAEWWRLRNKYQGVSAPVEINAADFDPASKYHIGANVPYIAYFVSYVLQFQFHRALCREAKYTGPLHLCSIYGSKEAGQKLREMMEAGRSKPWPKILKAMTDERDLSASAIMEYFQPLYKWLKSYRATHNFKKGWPEENLMEPLLQRKLGKPESGQERSGILKTSNGGIQLSINIPTITVGDSSNGKSGSMQSGESRDMSNSTNGGSVLDLAKIIGSGNPVSITTTETNAFNKDGNTEVANREVSINTGGPSSQSRDSVENGTKVDNSTGLLNSTAFNGTDPSAANLIGGSNQDLANTNFNATLVNTNISAHDQQQQQPQPQQQQQTGPQGEVAGLSNETIAGLKNINISAPNVTEGNNATAPNATQLADNATAVNVPQGAPAAAAAQARSCQGEKRSPNGNSNTGCPRNEDVPEPKSLQISPAELVRHLLLHKVKNVVQDSVPQARVEKTANGFTVNLDLNAKDRIPVKFVGFSGRQQHVNVFIAPKGVVVKPKSSVQLMKPSFVPVQNKDNLELRGG